MTTQNYLEIDVVTNIVVNNILWDGNEDNWQPPQNSIMVIDSETIGKTWMPNEDNTDWVLEDVLGAGDIGFTWDGTICITNEPKPTIPPKPRVV